jgi:hypothetical protein
MRLNRARPNNTTHTYWTLSLRARGQPPLRHNRRRALHGRPPRLSGHLARQTVTIAEGLLDMLAALTNVELLDGCHRSGAHRMLRRG